MVKFSVKKPLTVFVAVVAVIVLGVVAFTNMTPDLLPNMDMPYVVVVTSYPGSTPEKTEATVTRPLEASFATLENIENISSSSGANASTIFLEFNADVNMDTITVDILQNISQIEPYWDDMVGTPFILKINPSMLPVMVAAVDMEGMDTVELSSFMEDEVLNKLEGINGVASVSSSGMITENINVVLSQGRINALNRDISKAIDGEFKEAEDELEDAKKEIETQSGAGISLGGGATDFSFEMPDTSGMAGQLDEGIDDLVAELDKQIADAEKQLKAAKEAKAGLDAIDEAIKAMDANGDGQPDGKTIADLRAEQRAAQNKVTLLQGYADQLAALQAALPGVIAAVGDTGIPSGDFAAQVAYLDEHHADHPAYAPWRAQYTILEQQLLAIGLAGPAELGAALATAQTELAMVEAVLSQIELVLLAPPLGMTIDEYLSAQEQLASGIATAEQTVALLKQVREGLKAGSVGLDDAMTQLGSFEMPSFDMSALSGLGDMANAMIDGQMQQALAQVEGGLTQLEAAKESAKKQANLDNILSMDTLSAILTAQNFSMPVGYVHDGDTDVLVSVGDNISSMEELENLMLMDMGLDGLEPIYLSDVADIYMTDNRAETYAKINGNDGVLLTFTKQSNYATANVSDSIAAKFEDLSTQYEGLSFYPMMDQGDYIYLVINSILENLLWGAIFAVIVLFLFLRDLRPTFITLCAIPISVIFAVALMYFSGVTLNIISLSGLAVAVGMLVDNSVVVIENIYRLRNKGASRVRAAVTGAAQVAGAIASSTLTTVCVFLPIVFIEGITRQLFTDLALTMGYALIASLIVALTLVPAMSSGLLKKHTAKPTPHFDRVMGWYQSLLDKALNHKALVLAVSVLLLVGSTALVLARGFTFMPSMDMPQLTVSVEMPEDATREETEAFTNEVVAAIMEMEGVETTGAMLGGGTAAMGLSLGGGGGNVTGSSIYVLLDEESGRSAISLGDEINAAFAEAEAEVSASNSSGMDISALGGSGVSVDLYGDDLDLLQDTARKVAAEVEKVDGAVEVNDGVGDVSPEMRFIVDKEKAMAKGLTTAQVYQELAKALSVEKSSTSIEYEGADYDVVIIHGDEADLTPKYVQDYSFTVTDREGEEETVWLSNIATLIETESKNSISRYNQRRYLSVSAGIDADHNVTLVTDDIQDTLASYPLPAGMSMEFTGESETIMEAFTDLLMMLLLGILLVYLVMVAQFQSLRSPFIVMFTIPLAFTGGMVALLITGMELSVIALIGFVMLVGIIVNNGIVLVDYINQLREGGMDRRAAILEAGVTRMRPILMTSITTILGLLMMAVARGVGSAMMQPIAIVSIGGLVYGTLMTLFIVPVMYEMLSRKKLRVIDEDDLVVSEDGLEAEPGVSEK